METIPISESKIKRLMMYGEREARDGASHDVSPHPVADIDIDYYLKKIGGMVINDYDPVHLAEVHGIQDFTVITPVNTTASYMNFLKAVAAAHYKLHYELPGRRWFRRPEIIFRYDEPEPLATEARAFAVGLILTPGRFEKIASVYGRDLDGIADELELPRYLVRLRAAQLKF